jgi:hypothetical protein
MKRVIITISFMLALGLGPLTANSFGFKQASDVAPVFFEGDQIVNFGLGIGSTLYRGSHYSSGMPPLSVSYEKGFKEDFIVEDMTLGIGGYLGYVSAKWETSWGTGSYGWKYTSIIIGARAAVHYPLVEKLDTYSGLMLGYNIVTSSSFGDWGGTSTSASASAPLLAWYAGGRYYFSDSMAVFAEIGYGIAYLTLGVSLKLN